MSNPLVRKLRSLGRVSDEDAALLERISADPRRVPAGVELATEGQPPDGVILVLGGFAYRYKLRTNGARQILAYLLPGDFCDLDVALLARMDHSIATVSECLVARLSPEAVEFVLQQPELARALRRVALVEAANAREWLMNMGRRTAIERLAHLFCELLLRLQAVGLARQDRYELPLRQFDLADTTGLSAVHVNRSLQELRAAGLIELRHHSLTILDLPRLQDLAEFRQNYLHLQAKAAA